MKTDDFEKRLQRQPPQEIPGAWREEILTKAQASATSVQTAHTSCPGLFRLIQNLIFRPQRAAWAGLASVWLMILAMNLTARNNSTATTQSASLPTPETLRALKQQQRLLAELVDRPVSQIADRIKVIPTTGPRSQRREEALTV